MFQNRIPFGTFPIATDAFGNLLIMSMDSEGYGQIYFWDHEGEPEQPDGHFVDNCTFLTHTFSDLMKHLAGD